MKKLITIALLAAMLLTCFAGCGLKQGSVSAVNGAENVALTTPTTVPDEGIDKWIGGDIKGTLSDNGFEQDGNGYKLKAEPYDGAKDADVSWYDHTQSSFTLDTAAEFVGFLIIRLDAQSRDSFAGKTFTLTTHVDMNNVLIGVYNSAYLFAGTFDGGNHVIANYHQNASSGNKGFFSKLTGAGCVKNFSLINGTIKTSVNNKYGMGGVVGTIDTTDAPEGHVHVQNVYSDVDIFSVDANNQNRFGGIVAVISGTAGTAKIVDCVYAGSMTTGGNTNATYGQTSGGIVGYMAAGKNLVVENCSVTGSITLNGNRLGGIVGYIKAADNVTITGCSVSGSISSLQNGTVGGLIAQVEKGENTVLTVKDCTVADSVTISGAAGKNVIAGAIGQALEIKSISVDNVAVAATVNGLTISGGVIAYISDVPTIEIKNTSFTGTFTGDRSCGGAIGYIDVESLPEATCTIDNVDVSGIVKINLADNSNTSAGGIIGRVRHGNFTMKNCNFTGELYGTFAFAENTVVELPAAIGGLIGVLFDHSGNQKANPVANISDCSVDGTYRFLNNNGTGVSGTFVAAKIVGTVAAHTVPTVTYTNVTTTATEAAAQPGETGTVMAAVEYGHVSQIMGYQTTTPAAGKYDLRVVSTLGLNGKDADDVKVGFKVTVKYWDAAAATPAVAALVTDEVVYASYAYASINGGDDTYAADSYAGADYLYAFVLKNIPEGTSIDAGTLQLVITPIIANNEDVILETAESITIGATPAAPAA